VQALLGSGYVAWAPPGSARTQPRDLPTPGAPKPKPVVQIVEDRDPVTSWKLTKEAMTRLCDGNAAQAEDLLMMNPAARDLYRLAVKLACAAEAKRRNLISVSPNEVRL
jgi:hypothetical protein